MDIKGTVASQTIASSQAQPVQRNNGPRAEVQARDNESAVSVSATLTGENREASDVGERVNDALSRDEARELASAIAGQLADLPGDTGIVRNPALLEEASRGLS